MALAQKHSVRTGLEQQISRVENGHEKGYEKRLAELKEQLAKAESDDEPAEKQHDLLLRKALKESELQKFQAIREVIEILWAQLAMFSSLPFPSMEKSLRSSHRPPSLSLLFCRLFHRRQVILTLAWRRQAPSVLLCNMHWITGSLAKPPSPHLRERFWIVLTRAASAKLTLQNYSGSNQSSISSLVSKGPLIHLDVIPRPCHRPLQLFKFLLRSRFRNWIPRHRPRRRSRGRSIHPWPWAQHPRVSTLQP